jgi:phenylpropionate dioxygenase-like ring-hydroxylating dioxygenase large terminal subunit
VAHPRIVEVVRRACAEACKPGVSLGDGEGEIPISVYRDPARLARERERLFRQLPIPVAHANEVAPDGSTKAPVVVRELDGVSLLLTRGPDGGLRAFRNACRHRGVRLVREDCRAKAFVCPYHGWTYGIDGALSHVPHREAFGCRFDDKNLVPARVEERHGLVWTSLDVGGPDVAAHLGEIDGELASMGLENHVVGRRVVSEQRGNWKFLMEAFLEGYHIRMLHRATIGPFFLDARNQAERAGQHVRTASARRIAREIDGEAAFRARPLFDLATVSYMIFPATTLIQHPDWTSLIVVQPVATDRFVWSHTQLLPEAPATESARAHFERSFALIEGSVFQAEDLVMCAEAQAGIETGANTVLTFGRLESPALWFHRAIDEALA